MTAPNFANRTMWTGDNLNIMRGMNSESVALIYLDPPFNSNRNYAAPIGSEAAGAAFKDTWTLDDVDLAWHGQIAEQQPALYAIIDAARLAHGQKRTNPREGIEILHKSCQFPYVHSTMIRQLSWPWIYFKYIVYNYRNTLHMPIRRSSLPTFPIPPIPPCAVNEPAKKFT